MANNNKPKNFFARLMLKVRINLASTLIRLGASVALLNGIFGPAIVAQAGSTPPPESVEYFVADEFLDQYSFVLDSGFGEGSDNSFGYDLNTLGQVSPLHDANYINLQGYGTVVGGSVTPVQGGMLVDVDLGNYENVPVDPWVEVQVFEQGVWITLPDYQAEVDNGQVSLIVSGIDYNDEYRIAITEGEGGTEVIIIDSFDAGI